MRKNQVGSQEVTVGIRPDDFEIVAEAKETIKALRDLDEIMGTEAILHLKIPKEGISIHDLKEKESIVDEENAELDWFNAVVKIKANDIVEEDLVDIRPIVSNIHLFDMETGDSLCIEEHE